MPVVGCLTVAAGILARSEEVSKGTGTDQRFVKNALKNAELPPGFFQIFVFLLFLSHTRKPTYKFCVILYTTKSKGGRIYENV